MGEIVFTIKGDPKALKRHRTFKKGNFIGQYDPSAGDKEDFLTIAHQYAPEKPINSPIRLKTYFIFQRPKNHYKSNGLIKPKFLISYPGKPDIDNLIKFIMDSLNKVFWRDDSIIYRVDGCKFYDDLSYTKIQIEWDLEEAKP